jgi:UDP-glucose 4-epimerase
MAKASEDDQYYRVPADNRDLNYAKYFVEGETSVSTMEDYTSHNTRRLNEDQTVELLMNLDYVQEQLNA